MLRLQSVQDAEMVAAKGAGADDGDAKRVGHGLFLGCGKRRLDGLTAAGIQIEDLADLVLGFGGGLKAEAGGGAGATGLQAGMGSDKLQEVERDVFRAAELGRGVVHRSWMMVADTPAKLARRTKCMVKGTDAVRIGIADVEG